ncbi:unnamed protein product [Pleuronectes platessa]|uniref:Uncharacterized protein n=1 Tax=Pleuronectes platessa TaxID=8262 RepID=A0A9N7ULM4_PLEPL|nr:unnamed protein product [Pleuronectes platessa]
MPECKRGACKNGKQGFQREEEGGRGGGGGAPPSSPPLTLFIPPLPPQLAFHTPGSAIQTRSCINNQGSTISSKLPALSAPGESENRERRARLGLPLPERHGPEFSQLPARRNALQIWHVKQSAAQN